MNGVIVKTLRDGRLEVQYKDNQGMEGKKVFLKTTIENYNPNEKPDLTNPRIPSA